MKKTLYKFLDKGLKSNMGEHTWKIGEWYKHTGEISLCNSGFHASKTPLQALGYVYGEIVAKDERVSRNTDKGFIRFPLLS